jgi:hypothetical protein
MSKGTEIYLLNTQNLTQEEIDRLSKEAVVQDDYIERTLINSHHAIISPYRVHQLCLLITGKYIPVTSVHRSLNSLAKKGLAVKRSERVAGPYGVSNGTWSHVSRKDEDFIYPSEG